MTKGRLKKTKVIKRLSQEVATMLKMAWTKIASTFDIRHVPQFTKHHSWLNAGVGYHSTLPLKLSIVSWGFDGWSNVRVVKYCVILVNLLWYTQYFLFLDQSHTTSLQTSGAANRFFISRKHPIYIYQITTRLIIPLTNTAVDYKADFQVWWLACR